MKILQTAIKEYYTKANKVSQPACFNSQKEYTAWVTLEADAHTEPRKFPCRDCTSCYQTQMKTEGRCYIPEVPVARIVR